jgi:ribosomal protein S18 acetylase RimI-like enzyme
MLTIKQVQNEDDIRGIMALQQQNLKKNLTSEVIDSQGFVTVEHQFETLAAMNAAEPSIIIQNDEGRIVAYCLTMLPAFGQKVPELIEMFELFDEISYKNKPLSQHRYYVVGQVCVGENYRGQGIFDAMYAKQKEVMQGRFDLAVTEIALSNTRSMRAHERLGFKTIYEYFDPKINDTWAIVVWDWL